MKKFLLLGALAMLFTSCASDEQKDLEKARFYLDQGEYQKAIDLTQPIVDAEPNNNPAKFILASALVGTFALGDKAGCPATDTGYLGLLACLLDDKAAGDQTGLKTFGRIAPEDSSNNDNIKTAVDYLVSIKTFTNDLPEADVALQRLVARAFDVSALMQEIGVNSPNVACNSDSNDPDPDGIPDDYDSSNIGYPESQRFLKDLEGIETDAKIAGFDNDFNLITRARDILDEVQQNAGVTDTESVRILFDETYASDTTCDN